MLSIPMLRITRFTCWRIAIAQKVSRSSVGDVRPADMIWAMRANPFVGLNLSISVIWDGSIVIVDSKNIGFSRLK